MMTSAQPSGQIRFRKGGAALAVMHQWHWTYGASAPHGRSSR
jgi:hypothetical protein